MATLPELLAQAEIIRTAQNVDENTAQRIGKLYNDIIVYFSNNGGGGGTYKILDTVVSTWTASTTYAKYPYEAVILIENITESDLVEVIYSIPDAESTNYAPGGELYNGYIKIFAKVNTEITIPTLVITKIDL